VLCFGARAVHFIIRSDGGIANINTVTQYGLNCVSGIGNIYNPWQTYRSFNPSGTSANTGHGWIFSILPGASGGTSSDSAQQRRMWFEKATVSYNVSTANLTNLQVFSVVEWEA
jgi:hypothetical protein